MSVPLPTARTGGQILIQALCQQQVRHVFCVPGESYLSALDALHDTADITTVVCRHVPVLFRLDGSTYEYFLENSQKYEEQNVDLVLQRLRARGESESQSR